MKILDLKMQAFGPFIDEQHIEFTKLNANGMFLINGPTGIGKTSIFDAIVFALYGEGSGKDRENSKSLRSDFAKDDEITYVELEFEVADQIYRVKRQLEYKRKAKKGDGYTTEQSKDELYMPDGSVISRSKDVNEKIEKEILNIDKNQFKSVALLAQGEFTELITASSKDRASILEHIFNKENYNDFEEEVKTLLNKARQEKDDIVSSVNTLIAKVEDGKDIVGYDEALNDPTNIPTFTLNAKELVVELKEEIKEKNKLTEQAHKDFTSASAKLENIKTNNKVIQNYLDA